MAHSDGDSTGCRCAVHGVAEAEVTSHEVDAATVCLLKAA